MAGIGPRTAARLAQAGISSIPALLGHLPRQYLPPGQKGSLAAIDQPGRYSLVGRLEGLRTLRLRGGKTLVTAELVDGEARLPVRWWNRPYLGRQVAEGAQVQICGEVRARDRRLEMVNGALEVIAQESAQGIAQGIEESPGDDSTAAEQASHPVPVYGSLGPLGPARLRRLFQALLAESPPWLKLDPLPSELRRRHGLPGWQAALRRLHQPQGEDSAEALAAASSPAQDRFFYALALEQALARRQAREARQGRRKPHGSPSRTGTSCGLEDRLPFALTSAQEGAWREIRQDLRQPWPMRRLLQGDVGAGKTVVAALAAEEVLAGGAQVAYLAPTELLAEQQWETLSSWLGEAFLVTLCTAGQGATAGPKPGELRVGTHALLEEAVGFDALGLVIIDEQHRFGVDQRRRLVAKGQDPDLLVLTATPIPRSLALTVAGDLEVSCLAEGPPGRAGVVTEVLPRRQRRPIWDRLEAELRDGGSALLIYPTIAPAGRGLPSLAGAQGAVEKRFGAFGVAAAHGGLSSAQKRQALAAFRRGDARLLLATTVVEVGVDLPAASWMVIEGAERFGLATLHQLRGRLGRSSAPDSKPGRCVALHGPLTSLAEERLRAFASTTDGFRLAELDLQLRGAGEPWSTSQSGFADGTAGPAGKEEGAGRWFEKAEEDAARLWRRWQDPALGPLRWLVEGRCRRWLELGEGA